MNFKQVIELEDAFLSLSGQIEYGDISNMDIYWDGVLEAFQGLSLNGWAPPPRATLPDLVESLPTEVVPDDLAEIIREMMELTDKSSADTLVPRQLKELRMHAEDLEVSVQQLLENLKEHCDA